MISVDKYAPSELICSNHGLLHLIKGIASIMRSIPWELPGLRSWRRVRLKLFDHFYIGLTWISDVFQIIVLDCGWLLDQHLAFDDDVVYVWWWTNTFNSYRFAKGASYITSMFPCSITCVASLRGKLRLQVKGRCLINRCWILWLH